MNGTQPEGLQPGNYGPENGKPGSLPAVRPGWAPFLLPGVRVTARYLLNPETNPGHHKVSDALGYIAQVDAETITVETKRGYARIPRQIIVAVKEVPPPPQRNKPIR